MGGGIFMVLAIVQRDSRDERVDEERFSPSPGGFVTDSFHLPPQGQGTKSSSHGANSEACFCLYSLGFLVPPRGPNILLHNRRHVPVTACATSNLDGASADRLEAGSAIEVWHQGTLAVGNFRGRAEGSKNALEVELSCGNRIKIDGGQIVDVWAAGDETPRTPADWVIVREQASSLLTELPPHMLDLRPLWQRLLTEKAGSKKRVDSDRVARDLFRLAARGSQQQWAPAASEWAEQADGGGTRPSRSASPPRSSSRRRAPCSNVCPSRSPKAVTATRPRSRCCAGARAASAHCHEPRRARAREMALIEAMKNRLAAAAAAATAEKGSGSVWPTATLPLLAEVELVALGLSSVRKQIERVLSAFDQPTNSTGARSLLLAVGQWNEGEEEESANLAYSNGAWLDPFPKEALAEGAIAATQTTNRRMELARTASPKPAKGSDAAKSKPWWLTHPGQQEIVANEECPPSDEDCISLDGRVDLRGRCSRVFAIDNDATDFRDDAISYDAATATLAVHICDMTSVVPAGSLLDDVARLRLQTIYSGAMPLHMLPPPLLRECALSPNKPNECLSALLQLDAFGRVGHSRLVRSIIPPVRVLSFDEVDLLCSPTGRSCQTYTRTYKASQPSQGAEPNPAPTLVERVRRHSRLPSPPRTNSRRSDGSIQRRTARGVLWLCREARATRWSTRPLRCSRTRRVALHAVTICCGCRRRRIIGLRRRRCADTPT